MGWYGLAQAGVGGHGSAQAGSFSAPSGVGIAGPGCAAGPGPGGKTIPSTAATAYIHKGEEELPECRRILGNFVTEWASKLTAGHSGGDDESAGAPAPIAFEDAALVEQSRQGDMRAFGLLVARYQDRVFNTVLRVCGNRSDAEELSQEAFLKALERIGSFRGESGFYTWLFRIAVNLAISHRRRSGRVRFRSLTRPEEYDEMQDEAATAATARRRTPPVEARILAAETSDRIAEALEELDDEFRLVVVLRDIEEMDYTLISHVLEVPVGTVKSRLHRARCALRDKLADLVD